MTKYIEQEYHEQVNEALLPFLFEEYNDVTSEAMIQALAFLPDPPVKTGFDEEDYRVSFYNANGEELLFVQPGETDAA